MQHHISEHLNTQLHCSVTSQNTCILNYTTVETLTQQNSITSKKTWILNCNAVEALTSNTVSHLRRCKSSTTLLWKPQISNIVSNWWTEFVMMYYCWQELWCNQPQVPWNHVYLHTYAQHTVQSHGQLYSWYGITLWPTSGIEPASRIQTGSEIVKSNSLTHFLRSGCAAGCYHARLREICWYLLPSMPLVAFWWF